MMGRIDRQTRENFADLVMSIVSRDEGKVADALLKLTLWEDEPDRSTLERELGEFMDLHFYRPLKELELGKLLRQLLDMASKHRLRVPPDLFLMLKALSTVESLVILIWRHMQPLLFGVFSGSAFIPVVLPQICSTPELKLSP